MHEMDLCLLSAFKVAVRKDKLGYAVYIFMIMMNGM